MARCMLFVKGRRGGLEIHKFPGIRYQECNVLLNYKGGETSQVTRRNHIPSLSSKDITTFHIILYMPLLYWTSFSVTQQLFQALNELFQYNLLHLFRIWNQELCLQLRETAYKSVLKNRTYATQQILLLPTNQYL